MGLGGRLARALRPTRTCTRVRGRCASGRRSSRARPRPWPSSAAARRAAAARMGSGSRAIVPLIGAVVTAWPRRRRNSSGERLATSPRGVLKAAPHRRGRSSRGPGQELGRRPVPTALEPQADVGLEDLPGGDPLAAVGHRRQVMRRPRRGEGRAGRVGACAAAGRSAVRTTARQMAQTGVQRGPARLGGQRLEPPPALGVAAQDVVVVGQVEFGHAPRPRRPRRQPLDPGAQPVAEPAEPAAPDRVRMTEVAGRHCRQPVQRGERLVPLVRHGAAARSRRSRHHPPRSRSGQTASTRRSAPAEPPRPRPARRGGPAPDRPPLGSAGWLQSGGQASRQ